MKPGKIALFFTIVVVALAIVSVLFPSDGVTVGSHTYYLPSIHSLAESVKSEEENDESQKESEATPNGDSQLSALNSQLSNLGDSLRFWLPDSLYFDSFWQAAESAASRGLVLRVLHYGDSQIEMDRISAQLRSYMQETFGGGGPGLIPFRTIIASYAVRQSTSGELVHLASFGDSTVVRSKGNYGPMMQCFRLAGASTATVTSSNVSFADKRVKQFSRIRLLYNNRGDSLRFHFADKRGTFRDTASDYLPGVGNHLWQLDSATESFSLRVAGSADLYGIAVDNGPGVAVDNIPMRGCSGQQFTTVDRELLSRAYAQLNTVGLIILQFGGNSVPYIQSTQSINNYCSAMGYQIDYLHRCCPDAKILFVGPSDMSTRVRDQLQTYPFLPALIDSLAATATRHNAAYWSIYHAMGGFNSMVRWNRKGLAIDDYIHFTQRGAEKMGNLLVQALAENYRIYALRRKGYGL